MLFGVNDEKPNIDHGRPTNHLDMESMSLHGAEPYQGTLIFVSSHRGSEAPGDPYWKSPERE